jgi:hypothetical protein
VARHQQAVAGAERVALQQDVQRFDGAARDQQFIRRHAGEVGQQRAYACQPVGPARAQEQAVIGVDFILVAAQRGAHRVGRHAEVAVFQVDEIG